MRQDDLRFTLVEAAEFLHRVMGLDLAADDVAALESRTEGWAAGLQLAALSLQERGALRGDVRRFVQAFAGSNRYVLDYLFDEVLRQQSADIQEFLLQTSILDRLCAPLCEAVTGRGDSQQLLQTFEQANLFIVPLDQIDMVSLSPSLLRFAAPSLANGEDTVRGAASSARQRMA